MTKVKLKTSQNDKSPIDFIASVEDDKRRKDAEILLELFNRVTGLEPKMWGPSIIGYGRYENKYGSGREGEFFMTGFSPRKTNSTIYIMPGYRDISKMLNRLGKHKTGKTCLYINKLSDVNLDVLEEIILYGLEYMQRNYKTFDI